MVTLYDHIVVIINKNKIEGEVFYRAIHLAAMNYSKLTLAYLLEEKEYQIALSYDKTIIDRAKKESQSYLNDLKKKAEELEIREVSTFLEVGNICEIVKYDIVDLLKPDLIVCSNDYAQEMDAPKLLGRMSDFIANRSGCDVLIVKKNL
jgi:uspA domain protein